MADMNYDQATIASYLCEFVYLDIQTKKKKYPITINSFLEEINIQEESEALSAIKNYIDHHPEFGELEIVCQSHVDFYEGKNNDCTDDPIQAVAFADKNTKELYVAYRGTGNRRWGDNAEGFYQYETDMQEEALRFFDYVADMEEYKDYDMVVTGHSKGGNEATEVAMRTKNWERIKVVYSFDGQGFSAKSLEVLQKDPHYQEKLDKMYLICQDQDPVHALINQIIPADHTYYLHTQTPKFDIKNIFAYVASVHAMEGMYYSETGELAWFTDENGNIVNGEPGWLIKFAEQLNSNIMLWPEEIQAGCADALMGTIDLFQGGSMDLADPTMLDYLEFAIFGTASIDAAIIQTSASLCVEKFGPFFGTIAGIVVVGAESFCLIKALKLELVAVAAVAVYEHLIDIYDSFISPMLDRFGEIMNDAWDDVKETVAEIGVTVKKIWNNGKEFVSDFVGEAISLFKDPLQWVLKKTVGGVYASCNPFIDVDTQKLTDHAAQLRALVQRSSALDSKMNGLYWSLDLNWDTIMNLCNLLKANLIMDYSHRLRSCADYLEDTAGYFNDAENEIINLAES